MRRRAGDTVDETHRADRIEILGVPVRIASRRHPRVERQRVGVAAHRAAGIEQRRHQPG